MSAVLRNDHNDGAYPNNEEQSLKDESEKGT